MISVSKERYGKVKDSMDIVSPKGNYSIQQNCQDQISQQNVWIILFQNMNKVSCYINAVLQCLLHLSAIRK